VFQALAHLGSMRVGGEQREIASLLMAIIDGLMIQHLSTPNERPARTRYWPQLRVGW
jgi:hypothetical protein